MTKPLDPKDHRRGVVMLCHGVAGMAFQPGDLRNPQGLYLKDADFEADRGQGRMVWTGKIEEAIVFPDTAAALEFWKTVPKNHPRRLTDGKPNRPLTAYTVEFVGAPPEGYVSPINQEVMAKIRGLH